MRVSSLSRSARLLVAIGPLACSVAFPFAAHAQNAGHATPPGAVAAPNLAASADSWTTFKGDAQRTGATPAQVSLPLSLEWRYSSDGPTRSFLSSPLVLGTAGKQRLYAAIGNQLLCLDAQAGSIAAGWKTPQLTGTVSAPLTLLSTDDGDFILVATQGGQVSAFRAGDGGQAWQIDLKNGISDAGPLVVKTSRGTRIVVATGDGNLVALTPEGLRDTKWRASLGQYGNPATSAMSLSNNGSLLYVVATDGKLYAIDVSMGRVAWSVSLASQTGVVPVVAGRVVVTAGFDRVAAYDAGGGAPAWSVPSRGQVTASPAFRQIDTTPALFYGNVNGDFYSLDARDGKQNWKTSVGASLSGAPVVLDNMVLVGTNNGLMVALNPRSGAVLWQYRLKTETLQGNRGGGRGRGGRRLQTSGEPVQNPVFSRVGFQTIQDGGFGGGRFPGPGGSFPGPGGSFLGGAPGGTVTLPPQQFSKPHSVSAAPSVVNGQVFVLGDDATIYAFTTQAIDADAPRVVEPSISLNDQTNKLTSLLLGDQTPPSVPGHGPFYFAASLDDIGSGVDPKSVQVSLDGTPLDAKKVDFDAASGVLTVTLLDGANGGANFPDGQKVLTVTARDYAGNRVAANFNFFIDNTAPAPSPQRSRSANNFGFGNGTDGNGPDGNGAPGDNGPDGGPGDGGPGDGGGLDGGPGAGGPDDGGGRGGEG